MHLKAIQRMRDIVSCLVSKLEVEPDGQIKLLSLINNRIDYINFLEKNFSQLISPLGGVLVLLRLVDKKLSLAPKPLKGNVLPECLSEIEISELTEDIVNYYITAPREYEFKLLLPRGMYKDFGFNSIGNNRLQIKMKPLNLGNTQIRFYLAFRLKGLLTSNPSEILFQNAMTHYKFIIQMCVILSVFELDNNESLFPSELSVIHPDLEVVDLSTPSLDLITPALPIEISDVQSKLKLHNSVQGLGTIEERFEVIESTLKIIGLILSFDESKTKRLLTATSWYHDASASTNHTLSFIQLCIALEALLGKEDSGDLTRTLKDRCSYLIGTTLEEREEISENISQIYRVRSKLVHGLSPRLSHKEEALLDTLKSLVKRAIHKEFLIMSRSDF